ncbi:LANO_0E07360g1_1 [Lachancea nothofagi CBS 11611]|uniref:LANO_0E07360g1_1 n=1 Tax=Lachancea nothofagi CBS 11611 TaxID=1266666 RepID=A0A1G4JUX0_9SACH|nr:LANO_0E07360g1_1 [Lachancea nothofagi CBS 11611]
MSSTSTVQDFTVYVGNVAPEVSKELIYELFVQICPLKKIRYPKDRILNTYQGFAFVEFYSTDDAEYACKCLNNSVRLFGRTLKVRKANGTSSSGVDSASQQNALAVGAKLFVKNVDELVDAQGLAKIFAKFGPLVKAPEIFSLKQLRCAFVYYTTFEHSDKALAKLNNQMVMNKCITVDYALKDGSKIEKHGDEIERLLDAEAAKHQIKLGS